MEPKRYNVRYHFNNNEIIPFSKLKVQRNFETLADRLEWDKVKPNQTINSSAFGTMRFVKIDKVNKKIVMIDQDNIIRELDLHGRVSKYGECIINYNSLPVYESVSLPQKEESCYEEDFSGIKTDAVKYACDLFCILAKESRRIDKFYSAFTKRDPQWEDGKRIFTIKLELEAFESKLYIASPKSIFIRKETEMSLDLFQFTSLSALVFFWNLYTKEIIHFYRYYYPHESILITKYDEFTKLMNQMRC